jgi:hypothetical protein
MLPPPRLTQQDWLCGECQQPTPSAWCCPHCHTLLCPDCDDRQFEHAIPAGPRAGKPCTAGVQSAMLAERALQAAADAAE